ncbi:hypothetical protein [Frisingicoccus sp.]|uniref:hypothetical protein n=1 Tax=Frisingicoccus sp. TaxID=1918627 RepID=UPI003AB76E85
MNKTFRISFSLKNTYRVNSILYALKQIPLVKELLPDRLYQVHGLKVFANVIAALWEVATIFLGKFLYLLILIFGIGLLYTDVPKSQLFLHILFFLTIIGTFMNTNLFNPTKDKYYAIMLLRMDAKEYTLVNYGYGILKVIIGFLPFTMIFGQMAGLSTIMCLSLPFSIAGLKLAIAASSLWDYEVRGFAYNENRLSKYLWAGAGLLLAGAYGLPLLGLMLPERVLTVLFILFIPAGLIGIRKIGSFNDYKEIHRELLADTMNPVNTVTEAAKKASEKAISSDTTITSRRKGFEYLNELFIKRHQKILWKSTKRISGVCIILLAAAAAGLYYFPEKQVVANRLIMNCLPYFMFIMYMINRGSGFTNALFMNCDHSLLNYSFFKQPAFILKLFQIRLREIIKINAVPAVIIGVGLSAILYVSGGTEQPLNYAVIFVSILCMSVFFSVHYLTIYYLLQPYNVGTELRSGTYRLVTTVTYLICYFMMQLRVPTFIFGLLMIVFCVLYSIIACIMVYRLAPKTFRFRM